MRVQHLTCTFTETWLLLLLMAMSDLTSGGVQGPIDGYNSLNEPTTTNAPHTAANSYQQNPNWIEPYFDPSTPRNVTALVGKSAYLSCRVRNLGNKTVSWIRHRDIHILTVGSYTYTSDQRFQATHHQESDDWTLQIKWAQKRDGGMYECQISTQPVRSYFVRLNVVVPTATILGGPDLHVDKGSTINLTCTVKFSPEPPAYIFWYHHEEVINYDSSRGGVSVITEKGDVTTSFLLIQNADLADSGKYSCAPSNADVASVRVHVLNGEHPEAMQTGTSGCQYSWLTIFLLLSLLLCYNKQVLTLHATAHVLVTDAAATTTTSTTSINTKVATAATTVIGTSSTSAASTVTEEVITSKSLAAITAKRRQAPAAEDFAALVAVVNAGNSNHLTVITTDNLPQLSTSSRKSNSFRNYKRSGNCVVSSNSTSYYQSNSNQKCNSLSRSKSTYAANSSFCVLR